MSAAGDNPKTLTRYIDREQASYDDYWPRTFSSLPRRTERLEAITAVIDELPTQIYPPPEGLGKVQEEVRRLTATASPGKTPALGK